MRLGCQVVDFVGLHGLNDTHQRRRVGHVAIVQVDQPFLVHVAHPFIEIEVLDASRVERRRTTDNTVYFIPFFQKELGQERTVLTGNACNQCCFHKQFY